MSNMITENNAVEDALNCRVLRTWFECGHSSLSVEETVSAPKGMKELLGCSSVHMIRTHEIGNPEPEAPEERLVIFGLNRPTLGMKACQILDREFGSRDGLVVSNVNEGNRTTLWVSKDHGSQYHESKYSMGVIRGVAAVVDRDGTELSPEHSIWEGGFWDFDDMASGETSDDVNGELADWMANRKPYPKLVA